MLRSVPDNAGTWPLLRHDERLSGHQPLAGGIHSPSISWRHYLGGPLFDAHLISRGTHLDLLVPFGGCLHRFDAEGALIWKSRALGIEAVVAIDDLDDDGAVEIVASNGKSIYVIDSLSGAVLWSEYLGPPFAGGFMHTGARVHRFSGFDGGMQLAVGLLSSKEVVVYDFSTGARNPVRGHKLWMDDFFHPSLIAADLNGDGRDELVVTKLSSVYAFDPWTGERTAECRWSSGGTPKRNYGLIAAASVSGSGALDLVIVSDRVSRHIAMVANDGSGRLHNGWDRFIEHIYETDERELRFVASSVCDIDGDGRSEIVVSIYNENGDRRWWLEVIDTATGVTRCRTADAYVRGVHTEAGAALVFASIEHARVTTSRAPVVAFHWRDGMLRERWSMDSAAFVGCFARSEPRRALFRTDLPPADDVLIATIDGEPAVAILDSDGVRLVSLDGAMRVSVPDTGDVVGILACGDLDGDGLDELVVSNDRGAVNIMRSDGASLGAFAAGMRMRPGTGAYYMAKPMSTPVVASDDAGRYCAVPDGGSSVRVLEWDREARNARSAARISLRGRIGPEEAFNAVSWCLVNEKLSIVGSAVGDGEAEIVAFDVRGSEVLRLRIPGLPASPHVPIARTGVHEFVVADLAGSTALVVSGFRSPSMNSESTVAIDTESGDVLWELDGIRVPGHVLGPAPWNAASIESARGYSCVHFLAKDTLCRLDARSGCLLDVPLQLRAFNTADMIARGLTMDDFSAYGSVMPIDVDGRTVRLLLANYGGHGLIDDGGAALWWHAAPLSSLTNTFGGVADVDGDARLELGVSDATGDFICLDVLTGIEKWRVHLGAVATGIATCDIDGCGRAEFVVSTREGILLALGTSTNGTGLVKWSLDMGYSLGPVTIADFDGDGRSEILVVSGDGSLYSVS